MRYTFKRAEFNREFRKIGGDLLTRFGWDHADLVGNDDPFRDLDECLKYVSPKLLDYFRMMGLSYTIGGDEIAFDDDTLDAMKRMADLLWLEDERVVELANGALQSMCAHPNSMSVHFDERDEDVIVGVLMFVEAAVQFFNITNKL